MASVTQPQSNNTKCVCAFQRNAQYICRDAKKKKCSVLAFHLHDNDILRDLEDDVFVQGRCKGPQVSSVESLPELCLNVTPQRLQEVTPGANT